MSRRPCLDCGTPFTGRGSRCEGCRKQKVRARPRPTRDPEHRKLHHHHRNQWTQAVATGLVPCARCGLPITGEWDIDHLPTGAWHPSHARCNRQAGNKPL